MKRSNIYLKKDLSRSESLINKQMKRISECLSPNALIHRGTGTKTLVLKKLNSLLYLQFFLFFVEIIQITEVNGRIIDLVRITFRKERLIRFKSEIQKNLPEMKKKELFFHLLEVEDIIQAINTEIHNKFKANPALLLKKELSKWNAIHQGIVSTMDNLDYEELLISYNDPNYKSDYFEGINLIIETLNKHKNEGDINKLHLYIKEITNKSMTQIKRDFL